VNLILGVYFSAAKPLFKTVLRILSQQRGGGIKKMRMKFFTERILSAAAETLRVMQIFRAPASE